MPVRLRGEQSFCPQTGHWQGGNDQPNAMLAPAKLGKAPFPEPLAAWLRFGSFAWEGCFPLPREKSPHRATTGLTRADAGACFILVEQVEQTLIFETQQGAAGVPHDHVLLSRRWNTSGTANVLFHLRSTCGTLVFEEVERRFMSQGKGLRDPVPLGTLSAQ